ncbi:MAG: hypothetical protein ACYTFY_10315 [Planctomycetota bacterium]|jgi:hypothetical protein
MNNSEIYNICDSEIKAESGSYAFERKVESADGITKVSTVLTFTEDTSLTSFTDILKINIDNPAYIWTPNLCPEENDVVGDHAFRSPAVIVQDKSNSFSLVPDLDSLSLQRKGPGLKTFMFFNKELQQVSFGFADYEPRKHLYYKLTEKPFIYKAGECLKLEYYIIPVSIELSGDISDTTGFLWDKYVGKYKTSPLPQIKSFEEYAEISTAGVLGNKDYFEFDIAPNQKGAGFADSSSIAEKKIEETYFKIPPSSIWFHSWFNSFRTAFGLKYHAQNQNDNDWEKRAENIKNLLLSAPDYNDNGLFPALYDFKKHEWWCGVTRLGAGKDIFDLTTSAHTALWMLCWNNYIKEDSSLTERAEKIGRFFLCIQNDNGSFPGYVSKEGAVKTLLDNSAHCAMLPLFLCELYKYRHKKEYLDAVVKSCDFFIEHIIPDSIYHDFEAFFSCSEKSLDFYDCRTGQHAQNNLSLSWITDCLLKTYKLTDNKKYLTWGLRCLDRLSLYQQVWNPPYLSLYTFGGFGVMNTDGEWNDTRQVFFAEIYLNAYEITGKKEYFERGKAALKAGCALLCHPDHKNINPLAYQNYPDGLMPENYSHLGIDGPVHRSGFDWGAGALMTMSALIKLKYPDYYSEINTESH